MTSPTHNLALETSGRIGSFVIGIEDEIIDEMRLPPQTGGAGRGGSSELMHLLEARCKALNIKPAQIGEIYLSQGPGSFTGLRVGVTIAKMFAQTLGAKVIAIPTLDVVALNAPEDALHVAVGLNLKQGTIYSGIYTRDPGGHKQDGPCWKPVAESALRTIDELLAVARRPLVLIGEPLPPLPEAAQGLTVVQGDAAQAQARNLWQLGHIASKAGLFVNPLELLPLYVRPPEAVALWDKRHGTQAAV